MSAFALELDLRHLAWALSHKGYVTDLAVAIDAVNGLLVQELLADIPGFPVILHDAEPLCEGEWRTWRRQCESHGLDADRAIAVLTILLHTMAQSEGSLYV